MAKKEKKIEKNLFFTKFFKKQYVKIILICIITLFIAILATKQGIIGGISVFNPKQKTIVTIKTQPQIDAVKQFYSALSSMEFDKAWKLLSNNYQTSAKSFDEFVKSYGTTKLIAIQNINLIGSSSSTSTVFVKLKSIDDFHGQDQTKNFSGTWNLIKENGQWKLDTADISMISMVPDLVDCPISSSCGGSTQQLSQEACTSNVCCETKKDIWKNMSKDSCDNLKNQPPSTEAVVAVKAAYIELNMANNPALNGYTEDSFVNKFAPEYDFDPSALAQLEIAVKTRYAQLQAGNSYVQNTYVPQPQPQPIQFLPPPQIQVPHSYTTNCFTNPIGGVVTCFTN
jgi:hypothetical protein